MRLLFLKVILFCFANFVFGQEDLAKLLKTNCFHDFVTFLPGKRSSQNIRLLKTLSSQFYQHDIRTSYVISENFPSELLSDKIVAILSSSDNLEIVSELAEKTKPQRLLTVYSDKNDTSCYIARENLDNFLKSNANFYFVCYENRNFKVFSVINTPRFAKPVWTKLKLTRDFEMEAKFDLNGEIVESISISFPPYFMSSIDSCENTERGFNCKCEGIIADAFEELAKNFNFSHVCSLQPDALWGLIPSFLNDTYAKFHGLSGRLAEGSFDVSLSTWNWIPERDLTFDFVAMFYGPVVLALTPQWPKVKL